MNVTQIARECSGPLLISYVLNACIGRVASVSTLMRLQQHGLTRPLKFNLVYNTTVLYVEKKCDLRLVDQKWYALGPSNFVNTSL